MTVRTKAWPATGPWESLWVDLGEDVLIPVRWSQVLLLAVQALQERVFVKNLNAKGTGLIQLAARIGAHQQMGGLLADATGHGSPCRLNPLLGFSAAEGGQGAGEDQHLTGEWSLGRFRGQVSLALELQASFDKALQKSLIGWVTEPRLQGKGDFMANPPKIS